MYAERCKILRLEINFTLIKFSYTMNNESSCYKFMLMFNLNELLIDETIYNQ